MQYFYLYFNSVSRQGAFTDPEYGKLKGLSEVVRSPFNANYHRKMQYFYQYCNSVYRQGQGAFTSQEY